MKPQVSLVLSGGGARGIAHIGVIEELQKQGFEIHSITGTSMGAVVGAIFALGKLNEFKEWLYTLDKLKVFKLIDFTLSSHGLIKGDKVFKKLNEFISDKSIEDLDIYFSAVAVDLLNKKEIVFKKGSISEAIRASVAIPTIITPVDKNGILLVDGGLLNNIPVSHANRFSGDLLIAVNVNADVELEKPKVLPKVEEKRRSVYLKKINDFHQHLNVLNAKNSHDGLGYFDLINKTIALMREHIDVMTLEKFPPDLLINISRDSGGLFDFYKAEELVDIGCHATQKALISSRFK